jgi:hypothetical protein
MRPACAHLARRDGGQHLAQGGRVVIAVHDARKQAGPKVLHHVQYCGRLWEWQVQIEDRMGGGGVSSGGWVGMRGWVGIPELQCMCTAVRAYQRVYVRACVGVSTCGVHV